MVRCPAPLLNIIVSFTYKGGYVGEFAAHLLGITSYIIRDHATLS